MNIVLIILIILLIGAAIAGIIAAIAQCNKIDEEKLNKNFKQSVSEVVKEMSHQFDEYLREQEEIIQEELKDVIEQFENHKKSVREKIDLLDESEAAAKLRHEQKLKELEEKTADFVNNRAKIEAQQVQSVINFYQGEQNKITQEFEDFKVNIAEEREELLTELEKYKQKQSEIIEQYKREEEIKNNKNFYRIVISETAQQDIKKLKNIAEELHDPTVLYKLIYKTYYEKPFTEMIGRVIQGRGNTGIYKITNLENGRVYIGQTKQTFKERWRCHVKRGIRAEAGTQNKLYTAMWEDGIENFTFEVLSECSADELNEKEKEYIEFYNADTWGYNSNKGVG